MSVPSAQDLARTRTAWRTWAESASVVEIGEALQVLIQVIRARVGDEDAAALIPFDEREAGG